MQSCLLEGLKYLIGESRRGLVRNPIQSTLAIKYGSKAGHIHAPYFLCYTDSLHLPYRTGFCREVLANYILYKSL